MRSAEADGLPEDEKVSTDELQEKIQEDLEEYVQSTDIAAMQSECSDHLPEVPFLIVYTPRTLNKLYLAVLHPPMSPSVSVSMFSPWICW